MEKFKQYMSYLLRHKWYVFKECREHGLFWRGVFHDMSKFRPSEFIPYMNYFYGRNTRDKTGYYKPTDTGDKAFDFAWLLHQKRNDHHWQWWILPEDEGGVKILPMPEIAVKEMLCDWRGAGKAQGSKLTTSEWFEYNHHKMQLHEETERLIRFFLRVWQI